jgi:NTE family protein
MKTALILSGGGARAAYQVGVIKAIAEIVPVGCSNPFPIICGTSSGAINAAHLGTHANHFHKAVNDLHSLWSSIHSSMVHYVGYSELIKSTFRLFRSFFNSGFSEGRPLSLLDNTPLSQLLKEKIHFQRLDALIKSEHIHALCITALSYSTGKSINFYQGHPDIEVWERARRIGLPTKLSLQHLMASTALPALFPAICIHQEYYGDGALRQTAPISAALHLGADKLLIIGVSNNRSNTSMESCANKIHSPTVAQIGGHLLNSAFIDAVEEDIETLERLNFLIKKIDRAQIETLNMRPIDVLYIKPSIGFDDLAANHIQDLPPSMRTLLKTIGATRSGGGSSMASYILFESNFCSALMDYGYKDAIVKKDEIRKFLNVE